MILLWTLLGLQAVHQAPAPTPDARQIIQRSLEQDRLNFARAAEYTYVQRERRQDFDSTGRVVTTESTTWDVVMLGGRPYRRKIAVNDKPLQGPEAAKATAEFEKTVRDRQKESEAERRRRAAELEKRRAESRAFVSQIPEAYFFRLAGERQVDGVPVWVIESSPKPAYRPPDHRAALLPKFKGSIWIDQRDYNWVRVEAESIAPVSFGLFLARLGPGARVTFDQRLVRGETWLPVRATIRLDARIALFKHLRTDIEITWTDYRKFRVDSTFQPVTPE